MRIIFFTHIKIEFENACMLQLTASRCPPSQFDSHYYVIQWCVFVTLSILFAVFSQVFV